MTFEAGTAATYWSIVVLSENNVLVRGDVAEALACRFSPYSMTKNASTAGARARML
jgi:hypothetical protein